LGTGLPIGRATPVMWPVRLLCSVKYLWERIEIEPRAIVAAETPFIAFSPPVVPCVLAVASNRVDILPNGGPPYAACEYDTWNDRQCAPV
jgi:hypothetical protein